MGKNLTVQRGAKVSVSIELNDGQIFQVALHGRVVPCSVNQRREDAVLTSQKQREEIA